MSGLFFVYSHPMATHSRSPERLKAYEVDMKSQTVSKAEKRKELKLDQEAHEAQAKADKLKRHALDNGKNKKAEEAQDQADKKMEKTMPPPEMEE
jgi:hypothetical protein